MAAANESQGLKIAVAAFVSLTVILAVTCYFLYSNYDQTSAKLTAAEEKSRNAQKAASDALLQYDDMRKQIGSRAEEYEGTKLEIKAEVKKIEEEIAGLGPAVAEAASKVQGAGGNSPDLEDAKTRAQQIAASYASEPNKTLLTSLARLKDLLKTYAQVDTALARNYAEIRANLEGANRANAAKLEVETKAVAARAADLEEEQTKHVSARGDLLSKVDSLQTENAKQATEIATLTTKNRQLEEDLTKKLTMAQSVIGELNDYKSAREAVLDRPDGHVTYVDYTRGEVRTDITYGMGARPQMVLSIFDRAAPGIPTEKPKATIELTYVGERYSIARIVKTFSAIEPIRDGDIIYSAAWSPNAPMRFALIGKLDVNRDGRDDRGDLIRMIQAAGGIVDYDLPPPESGKEKGKITGLDAWYVTDDRIPLREYENRGEDVMTAEQRDFLTKRSAAVKEARLNGVRPMKLERLLNYLGYDFHAPIRGRAEAIDNATMKNLLRARSSDAVKKAAPKEEEVPQ